MSSFTGKTRYHSPEAGSADDARMRGLAGAIRCRGEARLRPSAASLRRLARDLAAARAAEGSGCGEALRHLALEAPRVEACMAQVRAACRTPLPAMDGQPRIGLIAEVLLEGGEGQLTLERLTDALRTFDAAQPLTQAELWAVPDALRVAVIEACAGVSASMRRAARECAAAEGWVRHPSGSLEGRGPAFFSHALMRCAEDGLPAARARLDKWLAGHGLNPERVVRQAQEARAWDDMRLDNLMAARRLCDAMDWEACFGSLCAVEIELDRDPSGVYPRMDDDSRRAVREQVALIARVTGLTERSVARRAVEAAREHLPKEGKGELSGGICWWLWDDAGRRALLRRLGRPHVRLPRVVPDPRGAGLMAVLAGLTLAASSLLAGWLHRPWLLPACLPLGWGVACSLASTFAPRFHRPLPLLKLDFESLSPDAATLVVTPVLLSDVARAEAACDDLEALGWLERDDHIACLLLGDFADADSADMPGDQAILDAVRERVARMNARAGRERFYYLHRPRTLLKADDRYMGRDRKRGALMDLNRVLLGLEGAPDAFAAEGSACEKLANRFRYVVTLDADTRMLPGTVRRLAGAMAHPLNRRYAVLQPRMESLPSACLNGFVQLFAGAGGVDTYPASVSDLWMDLTGRGAYAGKGIYDVAAFHHALDGALPEGRVLSHDLIEGAAAGAAGLCDTAFYDGFPTSPGSWAKRLHRWTRGDWQLLKMIFDRRPLKNGRALSLPDRFRMLGNLLRSLRAPALWGLFLLGVWTGSVEAVAAGMALNYLDPLIHPLVRDPLKWRRATAELAILPLTAFTCLDAALRALFRAFVSGRRLLEWVPSAEAERGRRDPILPNRIAALLMLPGLFVPETWPAALALFMLFWVGADWVSGMADAPVDPAKPLDAPRREAIASLARDTWRFFEATVPLGGPSALPPDNRQLDPPVGDARRTSPTNIALYLAACAAAHALGFIGMGEVRARLSAALDAMDQTEKWRGHLFNWIDIDTLAPLRPRYVSSVDSGNLAACAIMCAGYVEGSDPALAQRLRSLAEGMDFAALYDGDREFFLIGFDAETGRPSQSHYDLLASESRILSYTALMLGQVPSVHWRRLGRGCVDAHGHACLASWSGTMFEYLMPELLMPAPSSSLLGQSARAAVWAQMEHGRRHGRPWGVSESGFHAFDAHMRYQYRAFGLPILALSGQATGGVAAPYAAALALSARPREAADDLIQMDKLGWRGELGFYEAADYLRPGPGGQPSLVKSHMAHHQGMALCAMCNALTGGALSRAFMTDPRARAMSILLEERPCALPKRRLRPPRRPAPRPVATDDERTLSPDGRLADVHLLSGQEAMAAVDARGAIFYIRRGVCAHRPGGLAPRYDAARVYLSMEGMDPLPLVGKGCEARCDAGSASYGRQIGGLRAAMTVSLSPEDDTLFWSIRLTNSGRSPLRARVMDLVPVSLATEADWLAHPAFQGMFVRAEALGEAGLLLTRTARGKDDVPKRLAHAVSGARRVTRSTDFGAIMGRAGGPCMPEGRELPSPHPLDPASALCAEVALAPGETRYVRFAMKLLDAGEDPDAWLDRCAREGLADRAARLGRARALAMRDFLGVDAGLCHRLDRLSALLIDPSLAARAADRAAPAVPVTREVLWATGLSGDRPIVCMSVTHAAHGEAARTLARAHAWFASMNLPADLVFIDDGPSGYDRPVRGMLAHMIDACDLRGRERAPGGVWVLDGHALTPSQREAIHRAASAFFHSGEDFNARLRRLLGALDVPAQGELVPLAAGTSTLERSDRSMDNGFGGFTPDGYAVDVRPHLPTPAPWCWMLADGGAGLMLTERGGGFMWLGNSRSERLVPWRGDALREGWGLMPVLVHAPTGRWLCLLPGEDPRMPFEANYTPEKVSYRFSTETLAGETTFTVVDGRVHVDVSLSGRLLTGGGWEVLLFVDWLMGVGGRDTGWARRWTADAACFATGACGRVGWLAADHPDALPGPELRHLTGTGSLSAPMGELGGLPSGDSLRVPVDDGQSIRFCLGASEDVPSARAAIRMWRDDPLPQPDSRIPRLILETPDEALDRMFNLFLPHQARTARVLGRTGLYQPGGAFGFRDQLQDMLALIPTEPGRVRAHLLACAARQFPQGDVLHWWHPPFQGVRTRISDDRLFLPWVTAAYVRQTCDAAVLLESIPYLEDAPIPEGRRDLYRAMAPGEVWGTLHDHCMRAFRSVKSGAHGLALMGGGDWNDGMDRVGSEGIGESVWLSEILAACAESYADICPDPIDAQWLRELADRHRDAVERHGWDGRWYRRAWMDDGTPLGSADSPACRIDLIAQAWAVLAGLDAGRCASAMDAAWEHLVDERIGAVKLLAPPFAPEGPDPGYIRDYPAGVRENGAQYTHGACWYLLAMIRMGDVDRAHRLLSMLLPPNHADTPEHAARYRVEPYVAAADIYTAPGMEGRGGWTWYTGSAAWLYLCILELLGYERRGDRVRLAARLGDWNQAALTLPCGKSHYRLVCRRDAGAATLDGREVEGDFITLIDDGRDHEAVFPPA